ncbi:MAG: DUF3866 family protein [Armatimonadetes bacterium]|nr:DUF3866 family protein [Armatimonadota bacterium]
MLTRARGKVVSIIAYRNETLEIAVDIDGAPGKAIAYTNLTGELQVGDEVLLNTTAVAKGLGTGGYHFVMANLTTPESTNETDLGHVVKARYTPVQHTVLSVEENDSPFRKAFEKFETLNAMPIVIGQLHSQLAPAAGAIKRLSHGRAKVAYIMTDSAALPLSFSRLAHELRSKDLIDATITVGQAFGGEYEAVNIFTGLIAAKEIVKGDVAIVCPGPGNVGTGTTYGFSSIEQGDIVNAVNILGGSAIAIARISFADPRPRHQGLSHHTLTSLGNVALTKCTLALPMMDQMRLLAVEEQINHSAIAYKHRLRIMDGLPGIIELQEKGIKMYSMGRGFEEDQEYFLSAAAAGAVAAEMLRSPG